MSFQADIPPKRTITIGWLILSQIARFEKISTNILSFKIPKEGGRKTKTKQQQQQKE